MRARLLLDGSPPVEITKDLVVVGRKEECDLRLEHKSVSKIHCVLVKTDGLLLVRDLGSTNGTLVNGIRVRRAALLPNDRLTIANYKFRVYLGPDEPPEPAQDSDATRRIEAEELAPLRKSRKKPAAEKKSSDKRSNARLLHRNHLPDIYPDNATPGEKS